MPKAKTKAAGTNLPVPQTDADAVRMIAQLGALQVALASDQADHDAKIAELEGKHGEVARASNEQQTAIIEGLSIWASANRDRLTKGGKMKTVQLATGSILWRDGRFSVKHRGLKVEEVVGAIVTAIEGLEGDLNRLGNGLLPALAASNRETLNTLRGFLRLKTELNKDAMLAAREVAETIPGVTIPRGAEEFAVEPLAGQIRGDV